MAHIDKIFPKKWLSPTKIFVIPQTNFLEVLEVPDHFCSWNFLHFFDQKISKNFPSPKKIFVHKSKKIFFAARANALAAAGQPLQLISSRTRSTPRPKITQTTPTTTTNGHLHLVIARVDSDHAECG